MIVFLPFLFQILQEIQEVFWNKVFPGKNEQYLLVIVFIAVVKKQTI